MGILKLKVEGGGFDAVVNLSEGFGPAIKKESTIAVNKTAKFHKNQIAKEVTKHVRLKQKDVKQVIDVETARRSGAPTAIVLLNKTAKISLKRYGARQTKSGVTYRISRQGGRQKIQGAFGPKITKLGGHVYKRRGKARLPIQKLHGPSPAGVYNKQKLLPVSKKQLTERLEYEMNRRVRAIKVRLIRKNGRIKGLSTDQINQQISRL